MAPAVQTVALTFHWNVPWSESGGSTCPEMGTAFPYYSAALGALARIAPLNGWHLLGHGHPRAWGVLERRWRELGIERVPDFEDVLERAELLVGDNSSVLPEFASTGKPVLWLSAPWYKTAHGGRFFDWPRGQVQVDRPEDLIHGVGLALADPPEVRAARTAMVESVYVATDGHAAERAAAAIVARLAEPVLPARPVRVGHERSRPVAPGR